MIYMSTFFRPMEMNMVHYFIIPSVYAVALSAALVLDESFFVLKDKSFSVPSDGSASSIPAGSPGQCAHLCIAAANCNEVNFAQGICQLHPDGLMDLKPKMNSSAFIKFCKYLLSFLQIDLCKIVYCKSKT